MREALPRPGPLHHTVRTHTYALFTRISLGGPQRCHCWNSSFRSIARTCIGVNSLPLTRYLQCINFSIAIAIAIAPSIVYLCRVHTYAFLPNLIPHGQSIVIRTRYNVGACAISLLALCDLPLDLYCGISCGGTHSKEMVPFPEIRDRA